MVLTCIIFDGIYQISCIALALHGLAKVSSFSRLKQFQGIQLFRHVNQSNAPYTYIFFIHGSLSTTRIQNILKGRISEMEPPGTIKTTRMQTYT